MHTKGSGTLKFGLAAVLAVVFVVAVANSVHSIYRPAPSIAARRAPATPAEPAPALAPAAPGQHPVVTRPWPTFAVADIIAHDPFAVAPLDGRLATPSSARAVPSGTPDNSAAAPEGAAENLRGNEHSFSGRIQAVYRRGNRSAVLIDSRTLQPGDNIQGAGRIIAVDQAGIVIELEK